MHRGYKLHKSQEKINHLLYMNDIKRFAKKDKELATLIQAMRICNQDMGIEFAIEKCVRLIMKSGKRHKTEVIELHNQEKIRMLEEKETFKYSGILEAETIKHAEMIEKRKKNDYVKGTRKLLEIKLQQKSNQRDEYLGSRKIHSWRCIRPYILEMT